MVYRSYWEGGREGGGGGGKKGGVGRKGGILSDVKFPFKLPRRVEIDGRDGGRRPQLSHVGRFSRNVPAF